MTHLAGWFAYYAAGIGAVYAIAALIGRNRRTRGRAVVVALIAALMWLAVSVFIAATLVAAIHEVSLLQALDAFAAQWDYAAVMWMFTVLPPWTLLVWLGFAVAANRGWRAFSATN